MNAPSEPTDLNGKLLIAMPGMGDPRFERSVILICSHSDEGAMGLVINKPAEDVDFADLLSQLGIDSEAGPDSPRICLGGPVEHARGFVLHSTDYNGRDTTMDVPGGFGMTATLDILEDIAEGHGPAQALLALGYSGWGPGQLENEIADNGWLIGESDSDLVFAAKDREKWSLALAAIGIDPLVLSPTAGRA